MRGYETGIFAACADLHAGAGVESVRHNAVSIE